MRLRPAQKALGFSFSLRLFALACLVLLGALGIFLTFHLHQLQRRQESRFASLQKQLSPPLLEAARLRQRTLVKALLQGALDAHELSGIRFIENGEGWQETVTRGGHVDLVTAAAGYRFVILDQRGDGMLHTLAIELFAPVKSPLFAWDKENLSLPIALGALAIFALAFGIRWQAETQIIRPLRQLRSRFSPLRITAFLASEHPARPLEEAQSEFEQIENSFLQLLQRLQNEQRDRSGVCAELERLKRRLHEDEQAQRLHRSSQEGKLAALGEMAGGIAHEINNPLAILVGRASQLRRVLQQSASASPQIEAILGSIENTVFRIQELVFELEILASRPSQEELRPLPLQGFLQKIEERVRERFAEQGLKFSLDPLDAPEIAIVGRESELTQAFLYLLENGAEAAAYGPNPWIKIQLGSVQAESVTLLLIDSGPGIPSDIRSKIFQPFFSTKDVGRGRGTGLSLAKSIVEAGDGCLAFDFEASSTTLRIILPRHREPVQSAA